MKSLFARFKNSPTQPLASVADEEIPRYPPFAKGLPAASIERVLATQSELVDAIRHTLALPDAQFRAIVLPVVQRYAAFTHLLPASESHHHRGAGGLFRHGLEVAHWAALASEGVLFTAGATPLERKQQEPRWRLAVCLAGLLHDIGKPVSDLSILDREGTTQWNPYVENLADWAEQHGVERYFLRWRDKRHQRHEQFSVLVAERVLTADCLSHLTRNGPDILQAMLEAIAGIDRGAVFHALVIEADRKSVERDLKANHIPGDASLGVPVEKYLLDAMRRLVGNGRWTANTRGSRVWRFQEGLHVVWKAGAQEVCELLARDKIPGIPRDPDTLADILIERGLAIPRKTEEGRSYRYWRMAPVELDIGLYLLRLSSPDLIYTGEPPLIVKGRLLDEAEKENSLSREEMSLPDPDSAALPRSFSATSPNENAASMAIETMSISTAAPQRGGHGEPIVGIVADSARTNENASVRGESDIASGGSTSGPSRTKDMASASAKPVTDGSHGQPNPDLGHSTHSAPADSLSVTDDKRKHAETEAAHWLALQGVAGEWLGAAIVGHREPPVVPVRVVDGKVFLPHPEIARKLGRDPGESLKTLDEAGWIETDVLAPMRKVREIDGIRGVMLNREASRCWLALAGDLQVQLDTSRKLKSTPAGKTRIKTAASEPTTSTPKPWNHSKPAKSEPSKPDASKPKSSAKPQKTPSTPALDRNPEPGSVDDLVQRIREREDLPCPVTESPEWLSVAYSIIDWYVDLHPGLTRSRLIVALHRHEETQLEGDSILKVRKDSV